MLRTYRAGEGWLHRMPAGPKLVAVSLAAVALAALPSTWAAVPVAVGVPVALYAAAGMGPVGGLRELARQAWALRWVVVITAAGQLLFLGPESATANTARVVAAVVVAGLLSLTTPVPAMLDALERGLRPLRRIGVDAERAALLLTISLTTIPVLARSAAEVRDAQRARGLRPSLARGALPLLILALRHADDLGDALAARGIR
ncbi:energy-coupling factor transporter transmembrane component T [Microbacterium proteolyticum]|uniref:energy-coupling factor transporter transmembrane component T n=1 Tax=Microbacterium proteolyticum TaxID=1572644 RepID=UPI001FABEECC|nr:energy-coupling factor transporter transmembrane component T [Microbacterium proteolyticum]MCI9859674.1 energy-coupling factor transporter transmembrane protein EcfT [Microbacterium proteolyticum]